MKVFSHSALLTASFIALSTVPSSQSKNVIMPAVKTTGQTAALIFIEGAEIEGSLYEPLLAQVQNLSALSLWVGIPAFLGNTPEPVRLAADIKSTFKDLEKAGFNASSPDTLFFYGGHSLGTVFVQDYVADSISNSSDYPATGQVLTGGFLARKHYTKGDNNTFKYPVPTLTISGSLDGLARVSRTGAEAMYQQILRQTDEAAQKNMEAKFPVVIVEGMTHQQFASGPAQGLVKQRDLKPELTEEEAHCAAAEVIVDFIDNLAGIPSTGTAVHDAVESSKTFLQPLLDTYLLEGSKHFNCPAQIGGPLEKMCTKDICPSKSEWATEAQTLISGVQNDDPKYKVSISNQYANCHSAPDPNINNSTQSKTGKTVLNIDTFAQGSWETLDAEDTGFVYTSAHTISMKLYSRQCTMIKGEGLWHTNFSVDMQDFCAMINQNAFENALATADEKTRTRFLARGQNYTFGPDQPKSSGPFSWDDASIIFTDQGDEGVQVSSPTLRTSMDSDPGCYHFCKLLSPARAMEWIYLDGLRRTLCVTC